MDYIAVLGGALVFGAVAFSLFKCGQWIGEGVVLLRYIGRDQMKEFAEKLPFGAAAVNDIRRNATMRILGPLVVLDTSKNRWV
jgi:hypothetical protein